MTNSVRSGRGPAWLDRVCERLDEYFRDDLELTDLATEAGVHPVHLVRVFRRHFGITPAEYVRRRRVMWVCDSLRSGTEGISLIACAAGFYDQSHLNRVFRREQGMTPAQYRAQYGAPHRASRHPTQRITSLAS